MTITIQWDSPLEILSYGLVTGVGARTLDSATSAIARRAFPLSPQAAAHIKPQFPSKGVIFVGLLLAPPFEEFIYRKFLNEAIEEFQSPPETLVRKTERSCATSALFALSHLRPTKDFRFGLKEGLKISAIRFPGIFIAGMVFSAVTEKTHNLAPAILGHSISNALFITKTYRGR